MIGQDNTKFSMSWEEAVRWLRNQPSQEAFVKACYFDDPLLEAAHRFYQEAEWQAVSALLPKYHGKVLDVGAGRGIASYALATDGWNVTALEPNPSELVGAGAIRALVRETGLHVTVVESYGEMLPFANDSFDLIHARQVLHHARNLDKFCCELCRVLKSGGMLVATREHVISKSQDLQSFLDNHPLHRYYGGENAYTLNEYIHALKSAGFKFKNVLSPFDTPINYFPTTEPEIRRAIGRRIMGSLYKDWMRLPRWLISIVGNSFDTPGRLYTFVLEKRCPK